MILYYCPTCGRWQDVSFAQGFGKALLDGLFQSVPEEQRNALLDANVFTCPDGHGPMVQVQATDRIQLRSATDEPKTNSVDDLLKSVFEKPEDEKKDE